MTKPVSSEDSASLSLRFLVCSEADAALTSTVILTVGSDKSIKISVAGNDSVFCQKVVEIASTCSSEKIVKELPVLERLVSAGQLLQELFKKSDYKVEQMPSADMRISASFDMRSGKVIGRHEFLHDVTPHDSSTAERISQSIAEAFKKGPIDFATEIDRLTAIGDHQGAANLVTDGNNGLGFFGVLPPELLDALEKIEIKDLLGESIRSVREKRLAVAASLNRYDVASREAQEILKETPKEDVENRAFYENVIAVACIQRGETETAISMWRKILKNSHLITAINRGWVYRNLSKALPVPGAEAIRSANLSVDAFLEAGDKREAAATLMHLSKLLEFEGPAAAIGQLRKMLDFTSKNGLMEDFLRANIFHSLASRLYFIRENKSALDAALEAVNLLRGLLGGEQELISSLNLASILAGLCGEEELSEKLDIESQGLESGNIHVRFVLARKIEKLFRAYDSLEAANICREAEASGDSDLIAAAEVATAMSDPEIDAIEKLRRLEATVNKLAKEDASFDAKCPAIYGIVSVLKQEGEFERAKIWLRKILSEMPLDLHARDQLLQILWDSEAWGDAAIFTMGQIELHGELPGLLYAHGRSLLEAGDLNGALSAFMKALKKVDAGSELHATILSLREKALELGGTVQSSIRVDEAAHPILREDLCAALAEFSSFVSCEKRMGFWYKSDPSQDYKWVTHPERRAQDLLHTFLKARFLSQISVFEEIDTGAGRLDLYLKLDGGLSVVIELKMCGFGYSSAYASDGVGQIQHYMDSRKSNIGYLVVLDSRLDKNGETLISDLELPRETIHEVFVDVRPRVSEKKSRKVMK